MAVSILFIPAILVVASGPRQVRPAGGGTEFGCIGERLKGVGRPVQDEMARAIVLASLAMVDLVVIFGEDTPEKLIHVFGRMCWSRAPTTSAKTL